MKFPLFLLKVQHIFLIYGLITSGNTCCLNCVRLKSKQNPKQENYVYTNSSTGHIYGTRLINSYISQLVRRLTHTVFGQLILWSGRTVVNGMS